MIINRALLPAHPSPALPAARARTAVLSLQLPGRALSPQLSTAGARIYFFTADHAGLCLDVSPRHAFGGGQSPLATARRRIGSGDGGGWVQTPPLEFLSLTPCYNTSIHSRTSARHDCF